MSLSLDPVSPTHEAPPSPSLDARDPDQKSPERSNIPDPKNAPEAFTDWAKGQIDDSLPDDIGRILVVASELSKGSPEHARAVAAALSPDAPGTLEAAAKTYLEGGGAVREKVVPEHTESSPQSEELVAQAMISRGDIDRGLSRDQRADFSQILDEREQYLEGEARSYILTQSAGKTHGGLPSIDYNDLADILQDLDNRTGLTDLEKAYVWNEIASAKGEPGRFGYVDAEVHISGNGLDNSRRSSVPGLGWFDNALVRFDDPVLAYGSPPNSYQSPPTYDDVRPPSLGFLLGESADAFIEVQSRTGIVPNPGAENALRGSDLAFGAWEVGGFSAFTAAWRAIFVPSTR